MSRSVGGRSPRLRRLYGEGQCDPSHPARAGEISDARPATASFANSMVADSWVGTSTSIVSPRRPSVVIVRST